MEKGLLFIVSAPSGCGKGTILAEILKDGRFYYSVSATTRAPREGEQDGVNYSFLKKEQFEELISSGGMLEYAQYCGNYYGTPKEPIERNRMEGRHVILEIEVQGAVQVKKNCQSVIISCSALKKGETYYIYGGETKMTSFTVSSIITTVGSSGSTFPGGGGPGGRPGGGFGI